MKIKLRIHKRHETLLERMCDVFDAETFGQACADAFAELRSQELERSTSVGAMMDMLNMNVLEVLDGASITLSKV